MSLDEILEKVAEYSSKFVTVTGGEPLAQQYCNELLSKLCDAGYEVSLETSGALSVADVDPRVMKVMDLKTPDSGESERNFYENIQHLSKQDQVKFVISSRHDYDWAKDILERHSLTAHCEILFSPVYEVVKPRQLADWILEDQLQVRFQIQLHKILWGEGPGR